MSSKLICTQSMQYISVPVAFLKNIQHKCVGIEIYGDAPTARMQARDREKPKGGQHTACAHMDGPQRCPYKGLQSYSS